MTQLSEGLKQQLCAVAHRLVDQSRARIAIPPRHTSSGYWFGGGNLVDDSSGNLVLVGRFRNPGDSRLGLSVGERGFELAVYRSTDQGRSFTKVLSFSKSDLEQPGRRVLSIEGSALHCGPHGVELYVSSEKDGIGYPLGFESFLKPDC